MSDSSGTPPREFALARKGDKLVLRFADGDDEIGVRLVRPRPLSASDGEISFLDEKGEEVIMLPSLAHVPAESRALAEEELQRRYYMPRITAVNHVSSSRSSFRLEVETDRGPRSFAFGDANKNVRHLGPDHVVIKDAMGNRYVIPSVETLDPPSRAQLAKLL